MAAMRIHSSVGDGALPSIAVRSQKREAKKQKNEQGVGVTMRKLKRETEKTLVYFLFFL